MNRSKWVTLGQAWAAASLAVGVGLGFTGAARAQGSNQIEARPQMNVEDKDDITKAGSNRRSWSANSGCMAAQSSTLGRSPARYRARNDSATSSNGSRSLAGTLAGDRHSNRRRAFLRVRALVAD